MIVIQYICILLYTWQMPKFIYSEAIVERSIQSLNVDPIKCSSNDLLCLKIKNIDDSPLMVGYSDNYDDMVSPSLYEDEKNTNYDEIYAVNNEIVNKEVSRLIDVDDYPNDVKQEYLVESPASKVKRSLELVEEQPPEGTYRPPSNEKEATTTRAMPSLPPMPSLPSIPSLPPMPSMPSIPSLPPMPSLPSMPSIPSISSTPKVSYNIPSGIPQTPTAMPSVPSIPQPPTMPSTEPQYTNTKAANEVTTLSPDVEILETTTEDYGADDEPNCDYDPFTWVLKCGLNLITSMLGFSDTCCKPLF